MSNRKKKGRLSYYASENTFIRTIDQESTKDYGMTTQIRIVRAIGPDLEMKINTELQELERKGATIGRIEVHADRQFAYIVYTIANK